MDNMTLRIDPETRDLVFGEDGSFQKIYRTDTTLQNVRHALRTWKKEFFADPEHGTGYERIVGTNQNEIDLEEIEEIIREAVFQEPDVSRIDELDVSYDGRSVSAAFTAVLADGEKISLEVTA